MEEFNGNDSSFTRENSEAWESRFSHALSLHQRGVDGDAAAVKECVDELGKLRSLVPDNNLIEAYYGSATALLGRDEPNLMEKMNHANKGLKILDKAVAREKDNTEIRILRFNVCYRLPEAIFQRGSTVAEDLAYLAGRYEQDPDVFSQDYYWHVLYTLGTAYKSINQEQQAEQVWYKLLSLDPDSKYKKLLKKQGIKKAEIKDSQPVIEVLESSDLLRKHAQDSSGKEKPDKKGKVLAKSRSKTKSKKSRDIPPKGIKLYEQALAGNSDAARKAADYFAEALEERPHDELLQAIHYDSMSLSGRFSQDSFKMFGSAINGTKNFDGLLSEHSDSIELRFIRAYHSFRLPEAFFKRSVGAIADFEYLAERYENEPEIFPEESYWQLLLDLGVAYERLNRDEDAIRTWEKLLEQNPDPKYLEMINRRKNNLQVSSSGEDLSVDDKKNFFREATRLHELGLGGNKKAAHLAMDMWEDAAEAYPDDPIAQAYYGSSMALVGRDAGEPQLMFGNGLRGLKIIRQACGMDPDNLDLKRLRGFLLYSLPESFFHLGTQAIKDFQDLAAAYKKNRRIFSQEMYHEILYDLGMAYQRTSNEENAQRVWRELLNETTNPKYQELLRERM